LVVPAERILALRTAKRLQRPKIARGEKQLFEQESVDVFLRPRQHCGFSWKNL